MTSSTLPRRAARRIKAGLTRGGQSGGHSPDELSHRIDKHTDRLNTQRDRLDRQNRRIQHLERVEGRLDEFNKRYAPLNIATRVMQHQVSALETRLADVTEELHAAKLSLGADDADNTAVALDPDDLQASPDVVARRVLAEIRAAHARIRVRFQLLSEYEERSRRLEDTIASALPEVAKAP